MFTAARPPRAHVTHVTVILCQLLLYIATSEGHDPPLPHDQVVRYRTGDALHFVLRFNLLPEITNGGHWVSTLLLNDTNSSRIIDGPVEHSNSPAFHMYSKVLEVPDDGTIIYVQLLNKVPDALYYNENILTLVYRNDRSENNKHKCLSTCSITVEKWSPKENRFVRLFPNGTREVRAGEKLDITCRGYRLHDNTKIVIYKDQRREVTVITEPVLDNVTYYRVGDRFTYNCTSATQKERTNFSWIPQKDGVTINSTTSHSSVDIRLDGSYNNTSIKCVANFMNDSDEFAEKSITTKLILIPGSPREFVVPWYIVLIIVTAIILTALATLAYFYRTRRKDKDEYVVEVQNELYVAESGLVYDQVYEHRREAPPALMARNPYSNIVECINNKK